MSKLSKTKIEEYLSNCGNTQVFVFESIDSTNSEAKRRINEGFASDGIFVAEHQTKGRGRQGKSFFSPAESGIYFTAVLHPNTSIEDTVGMTAAAAVVVTDVLERITNKHPMIKWVNDIFIDGKKVCGILAEAVSDFESNINKAVIVGIGINLTTDAFPEEISQTAGNIGTMPDKNLLSAELFMGLKAICSDLTERRFMDTYRNRSMVLGKTVTFSRNDIDYYATALDILKDGSLKVITDRGEELLLNSGEISIRF